MGKWMPILEWLPQYRRSWLGGDLVAGATVWAIMIPTALAYSGIIGVDPVVGLYTVPLALIAYAVFGSSKVLVVGPDAAISVLAGASIAAMAVGGNELDLAVALAFMVALIFGIFFLLRLGWVADLIPDSVLKGVLEGLAWVTILKQMPYLLGIKLEGGVDSFFAKLIAVVQALPETHGTTIIVGVSCILAMVVLQKLAPRLPGPLIVLVASIVIVSVLGLGERGVAILGETEAGDFKLGFPGDISLGQFLDLVPAAMAIVLMGFTAGVAALKRAAEKTGQNMDPDRELLAFGLSNLGSGLSGGYVVTGAMSKTEVGLMSGARSQVGNLFTAGLTILTILFLLPFFSTLADAALAALVIVVMSEISDIRYFVKLWRIHRVECVLGVIAFVGVLLYGVLNGVLIGVVLSLVVLADHIRRPPTAVVGRNASGAFVDLPEHEDAEEIPGMLIWRQYAPLVFLNARNLANKLRDLVGERSGVRVVAIDATASSGVDTTAISAFASAVEELRGAGIELWVVNVRDVAWQRIVAKLEEEGIAVPLRLDSLDEAVDRFKQAASGT
jgi:high affinity sulfate transporter 1